MRNEVGDAIMIRLSVFVLAFFVLNIENFQCFTFVPCIIFYSRVSEAREVFVECVW